MVAYKMQLTTQIRITNKTVLKVLSPIDVHRNIANIIVSYGFAGYGNFLKHTFFFVLIKLGSL